MKIVIIGAVAAGTAAAAKARRNSEDAQITIYEKDSYISYSGCGMPYYIGGEVESARQLFPRDPAFFKSKYNVDVLTRQEVLGVDPEKKTVAVKNLETGEVFSDRFDKLIFATGATSALPPIKGADHAFTLRSIGDMNKIKAFIDQNSPKTAVIIGTGFIGLEMCENLKKLGMKVTLLEKMTQVAPGLDEDMTVCVREHIEKNGVTVLTGVQVGEITDTGVYLEDGTLIGSDMVLVCVGVRPNTQLARQAGIALGEAGAIRVNDKMQTNVEDIYACGDCAQQWSILTGKPLYRPLGSTASKTGRIAGDSVTGGSLRFRGILETAIFRIFDMTVAQTGLSEREANKLGYDVAVCHNIKPDRPEYLGGRDMVIKAVADRRDGRLLGAQIVGFEGVDKRIDVFVTAITFKAKAEELFDLDLAYAPPFSTTRDPVMYTGMILDNILNRERPLMTAQALESLMESGESYTLIDARDSSQYDRGHIDSARSIPLAQLREAADGMDKETVSVTYCNKGVTGNAAQNILINKGFKKVYNLSGGYRQFKQLFNKDR